MAACCRVFTGRSVGKLEGRGLGLSPRCARTRASRASGSGARSCPSRRWGLPGPDSLERRTSSVSPGARADSLGSTGLGERLLDGAGDTAPCPWSARLGLALGLAAQPCSFLLAARLSCRTVISPLNPRHSMGTREAPSTPDDASVCSGQRVCALCCPSVVFVGGEEGEGHLSRSVPPITTNCRHSRWWGHDDIGFCGF